ncbi:MAG: TerC/Alx family metal homeostasis membrane protein [Succinivibrionaceae bacterium]|nr:TerC/Alx family metal homeostasis membrane protein [Succinivibrionaceae bacterium]
MTGTHIGLDPATITIFVATVAISMVVDFYAHRKGGVPTLRSAVAWTLFWVAVAACFACYLRLRFNAEVAELFVAGYLFEQSLSVDNLFVMMAIFAWFHVPPEHCHKVLYLGVLGAVVMRLIFVVIGASLFAMGPWMQVLFALFIAGSAVAMIRGKGHEGQQRENLAVRLVRRALPLYPHIDGPEMLLSREEALARGAAHGLADGDLRRGARLITPLFLCAVTIETTDVLFAFDSVPAVIAVSREPLVIYSAMMFAVLGLRSMYFVLDALRRYLIHLEKAVIALLFFIAIKLLGEAAHGIIGQGFSIPTHVSLWVIALLLGAGVAASAIFPRK